MTSNVSAQFRPGTTRKISARMIMTPTDQNSLSFFPLSALLLSALSYDNAASCSRVQPIFQYVLPLRNSIPLIPFVAAPPHMVSSPPVSESSVVHSPPLYIANRASRNPTNVYIRGLSSDTTDASLHALGSLFGRPISVRALLHHSAGFSNLSLGNDERGSCKGVGFVLYENEKIAGRAVEGLRRLGWGASFAKMS